METTKDSISYYQKTNLWFLYGLWVHLPIVVFTAWSSGSSLVFALMVSLGILSVPTFLTIAYRQRVETSIALACGLVSFSALLIHASGGMTELHFHIFTSLGIAIVLAEPLAIICAVLLVAVHHVAFFFLLPESLINYKAGFHILVIHAVFALATGIPAAFVAQKFKRYVVSVRSIALQVSNISQQIEASSQKISEASHSLAASSVEEASVMTETSATVRRLSEIASSNASESQAALKHSNDSFGKASDGQKAIYAVCGSVDEIKNANVALGKAVETSNGRLSEILTVIGRIDEKTKVINDIVFQTKLLSFNASVEAARAGEHGKGFSVVAQEIGSLAAVSGQSSKDIRQLVDESIHKVKTIVEETKQEISSLMQSANFKVEIGLKLSHECQNILDALKFDTSRIAETTNSIAISSTEQAEGVKEISLATTTVEETSNRNADLAQTTALVAAELMESSNQLSASLDQLKVAIGDR